MLELLDVKLVFAVLATVITIGAFYPYIRDIFARKTKPHMYTWLVWAITQGTATAAIWYGGGKFAAIGLAAGTLLIIFVFFLSFKYGSKDITKSDTLVLIAALMSIVVWWQLNNPLLAVFMVTMIDGLGYIPTYRKSFIDPWTETPSFWFAVTISAILILLANDEYNLLTTSYISIVVLANAVLFILLIVRRTQLNKQK